MVAKNKTDIDATSVTTSPDEWEWETHSEESGIKVVFDTIGDVFVGQFRGIEHIEPKNGKDEPFDLFKFTGQDGETYSVNTSYKLNDAMKDVELNTWVRITYKANVECGRPEPMKDFRVDVRKS